ncbi:MAG: antibiotic biosynthesis monooxygenase [Rhizobacter sp.]|nr:antibiotic biosynthesis monooxygenase [Chlorobiales bacterium]
MKKGLLATVKAKAGKEKEVSDFLASAVALARQEDKTLTWYAFQIDHSTFGIFDTFEAEEGREAHLAGEIAKALMASAEALLSEGPKIQKIDVLATK